MEPVESEELCSKLRCSDIAAETFKTLTRMNDMNTQIRSIISAPVLHPIIAPAYDLGAKLLTIIDLQSEVAQLTTNLANLVNSGSMDHFMVAQGILDHIDNNGNFVLLALKLDTLKANLLEMTRKLPKNYKRLHCEAQIQFHSKRYKSTANNSTAVTKQ